MKNVLPDFQSARILVVGDIMLDRYWSGAVNRISPEAPVPVVTVDKVEERPGGAANVAMNIAALGAQARLLGLTGKDEAASILQDKLVQVNVDCDFMVIPKRPTITKLRVLGRHQQLLRLDFEAAFKPIDATRLLAKMSEILCHYKVVVLSDYAKGTLSDVQGMIKLAREANIPVLIDPKGSDFSRYKGATLLTPNMAEFEAVVGKCKDNTVLEQRGMQLIRDHELDALLITRSEQGMSLLQSGAPPLHLPTLAQEVYDVTGAGDTVIGVLAAALASNMPLEGSCYLANIAAGIVVGKLGSATVSPIELESAVHGRASGQFGVLTELQLKEALMQARQRGEKIVMTNGCFDILHAGHVSYLRNARKLGDRLIVAVNTDESTQRLKGTSRPINPLEQRMFVLAALSSVDWVVSFSEDTPQRLIATLLPDVLVKGGDYRPDQIAGGKEVLAAGGEVRVLNFESGCSTSSIIQRIQQNKPQKS